MTWSEGTRWLMFSWIVGDLAPQPALTGCPQGDKDKSSHRPGFLQDGAHLRSTAVPTAGTPIQSSQPHCARSPVSMCSGCVGQEGAGPIPNLVQNIPGFTLYRIFSSVHTHCPTFWTNAVAHLLTSLSPVSSPSNEFSKLLVE